MKFQQENMTMYLLVMNKLFFIEYPRIHSRSSQCVSCIYFLAHSHSGSFVTQHPFLPSVSMRPSRRFWPGFSLSSRCLSWSPRIGGIVVMAHSLAIVAHWTSQEIESAAHIYLRDAVESVMRHVLCPTSDRCTAFQTMIEFLPSRN